MKGSKQSIYPSRRHKKKNNLLPILVFGLVAITAWGIKAASDVKSKVFVPRATMDVKAIAAGAASTAQASRPIETIKEYLEKNIPIDIVLLGYGGATHEGTYLTDSIIAVRIDPKLSKITLISIPRDIWIKVGSEDKYGKINSAYYEGLKTDISTGGKMAKSAISQVTGLPINYFVGIDFAGFIKTIDALGGVDVRVETTFDDEQYPIEGKEDELCGHTAEELALITATASATKSPQLIFPCRYEQLHFDAGVMHMDGATALKFVRSRHSAQDGSDFGRARRQKNLLVAVKQRVLSINFLSTAVPFVNKLGDSLKTDLSVEDVTTFISNSNTLSKYKIANIALTDDNYLTSDYSADRQYILIPKAGLDNWSEVHKYIQEELNK